MRVVIIAITALLFFVPTAFGNGSLVVELDAAQMAKCIAIVAATDNSDSPPPPPVVVVADDLTAQVEREVVLPSTYSISWTITDLAAKDVPINTVYTILDVYQGEAWAGRKHIAINAKYSRNGWQLIFGIGTGKANGGTRWDDRAVVALPFEQLLSGTLTVSGTEASVAGAFAPQSVVGTFELSGPLVIQTGHEDGPRGQLGKGDDPWWGGSITLDVSSLDADPLFGNLVPIGTKRSVSGDYSYGAYFKYIDFDVWRTKNYQHVAIDYQNPATIARHNAETIMQRIKGGLDSLATWERIAKRMKYAGLSAKAETTLSKARMHYASTLKAIWYGERLEIVGTSEAYPDDLATIRAFVDSDSVASINLLTTTIVANASNAPINTTTFNAHIAAIALDALGPNPTSQSRAALALIKRHVN